MPGETPQRPVRGAVGHPERTTDADHFDLVLVVESHAPRGDPCVKPVSVLLHDGEQPRREGGDHAVDQFVELGLITKRAYLIGYHPNLHGACLRRYPTCT